MPFKVALYGAHSSLGSAVLCELLSRQHETVVVINDFNAMVARPGLRAKAGNLFDGTSVARSIAGTRGVICLFDSHSTSSDLEADAQEVPSDLFQATSALLVGLSEVGVDRLVLVADFAAHAEEKALLDAQRLISGHPLKWTLADVPGVPGSVLGVDDFSDLDGLPGNDERVRLRRIAAALVDELEQARYVHQQIQFSL